VSLATAAPLVAAGTRSAGYSRASACALLALLAAVAAAAGRATASETLLLLPHLGLQVESLSVLGAARRRFEPLERIAAVVINEAVTTTCVYFYLAVALRGEGRLLLPFAALRPRLNELLGPYLAVRGMLPADAPAWPAIGCAN